MTIAHAQGGQECSDHRVALVNGAILCACCLCRVGRFTALRNSRWDVPRQLPPRTDAALSSMMALPRLRRCCALPAVAMGAKASWHGQDVADRQRGQALPLLSRSRLNLSMACNAPDVALVATLPRGSPSAPNVLGTSLRTEIARDKRSPPSHIHPKVACEIAAISADPLEIERTPHAGSVAGRFRQRPR